MDRYCAVFRDAEGLQTCARDVQRLKEEYEGVAIDDRGSVFNQDVLGAIELGYMLDCAEATAISAIHRTESRGAHFRTDYPRAQRRGVAEAHQPDAGRRGRAAHQLLAL